ncbi:hypothetical protein [Oricola thermophila]|uniref:Uncharacterized protein n=1 Tax=Oricola thermophila TaxID=2742145 RepID=A0A6N1VGY8_9HYPH|nr:hypothetical protein [Oricola thermophila]QKV20048.1 hypothetical protein HTY61_17125 [Oricola thermophila]
MTRANSNRRARPALAERRTSPSDETPELDRRLDDLLEATVAGMLSVERKPDPMFGRHGETIALAHLAYGHEARLIEDAAILMCEAEPHLQVIRLDRPFPLVAAAFEALQGNDWSTLEGIRLPSRVYAEDSYMPDLVVLDRRSMTAYLLDIKRAIDNKISRIRALMTRLKAAALVAPDWLSMRARVHGVACTRIAILDASGAFDEPETGIMPLAALEQVLDVPGLAVRMADLRDRFALRIEQEMDRLLPDASGGVGTGKRRSGIGADAPDGEPRSDSNTDTSTDDEPDTKGAAASMAKAQGRARRVGFAIPGMARREAQPSSATATRH